MGSALVCFTNATQAPPASQVDQQVHRSPVSVRNVTPKISIQVPESLIMDLTKGRSQIELDSFTVKYRKISQNDKESLKEVSSNSTLKDWEAGSKPKGLMNEYDDFEKE
jgi:glycine cleavage system protein P-like pyridoxal-binding family